MPKVAIPKKPLRPYYQRPTPIPTKELRRNAIQLMKEKHASSGVIDEMKRGFAKVDELRRENHLSALDEEQRKEINEKIFAELASIRQMLKNHGVDSGIRVL